MWIYFCFFSSVNSFVHTKLRMAINTSRCKQRFLKVRQILLCCLVFFLFCTLGDTIWNRNQILAPPLANKTVYFTSLYLNFFLIHFICVEFLLFLLQWIFVRLLIRLHLYISQYVSLTYWLQLKYNKVLHVH